MMAEDQVEGSEQKYIYTILYVEYENESDLKWY